MMQTKIIIGLIVVVIGSVSGCLRIDSKVSGLNSDLKAYKDTVLIERTKNKVISTANDTLLKALENKKENANVINLQFDKTKLKNGSTLVIDSKQLQALSCDTANIVRWYEGLPRKEQRKFR